MECDRVSESPFTHGWCLPSALSLMTQVAFSSSLLSELLLTVSRALFTASRSGRTSRLIIAWISGEWTVELDFDDESLDQRNDLLRPLRLVRNVEIVEIADTAEKELLLR